MEKEIKLKFTILFYVELTIVKNADCINFLSKLKIVTVWGLRNTIDKQAKKNNMQGLGLVY